MAALLSAPEKTTNTSSLDADLRAVSYRVFLLFLPIFFFYRVFFWFFFFLMEAATSSRVAAIVGRVATNATRFTALLHSLIIDHFLFWKSTNGFLFSLSLSLSLSLHGGGKPFRYTFSHAQAPEKE